MYSYTTERERDRDRDRERRERQREQEFSALDREEGRVERRNYQKKVKFEVCVYIHFFVVLIYIR